MAHLSGFACVLQVDGYGGYRALAESDAVRRRFAGRMSVGASTS
jgi:hypothetical protein